MDGLEGVKAPADVMNGEVLAGTPPKIYAAISAIMGELEAIGKDHTNKNLQYKYRSIDDLCNALQPLMVKNKVITVPAVINEHYKEEQTRNGGSQTHAFLKVRFSYFAEDGSSVSSVTMGEGTDSGDKASNKAMTAAQKYSFLQVFTVRTQDEKDPDGETPPETKPPAREAPPKAKPKATPAPARGPQGSAPKAGSRLTEKQIARLYAIAYTKGWSRDRVHSAIQNKWKLTSAEGLNRKQYDELCAFLLEQPNRKVGSDEDIKEAAEET